MLAEGLMCSECVGGVKICGESVTGSYRIACVFCNSISNDTQPARVNTEFLIGTQTNRVIV